MQFWIYIVIEINEPNQVLMLLYKNKENNHKYYFMEKIFHPVLINGLWFLLCLSFLGIKANIAVQMFFCVFDTMSTNILNYIKACRKTWNNTTQKELWYNLVTKKCAAHEWEFLWNILMRIKSKDKTLTKLCFWDLFHMARNRLK